MTHHYTVRLLDTADNTLVDLEPLAVSEPTNAGTLVLQLAHMRGVGTKTGVPFNIRVYRDYMLHGKADAVGWQAVTAGQHYSAPLLNIYSANLRDDATMNSTSKACGCGLRAAGCGGIHQDYCDLAGMSEPMGY